MKRILIITAFAVLAAFAQKIETQKADRQRITRVATTPNHLTVLEFNESVNTVKITSCSANSKYLAVLMAAMISRTMAGTSSVAEPASTRLPEWSFPRST